MEILPARMINEYVYCPRLYYYEHVEGIFVHNADTLAGKAQHKRVDTKKAGKLPDAEGEEELADIHSRSVSLFSQDLGVTAKLDLVEGYEADELSEGEAGASSIRPVEYKKGSPFEGEEGIELWDTDKIQLGLQILLLRENGYACSEGVVFYRETRQRVRFFLDEETETWIRETVEAVREAGQRPIPPPLDLSSKCPRCSLVSVCLPDETHLLGREVEAPPQNDQMDLGLEDWDDEPQEARLSLGPFAEIPEIRIPALKPNEDVRRLIAPSPESKALYLNTPGHYVSKSGENLVIKEKGKKLMDFRLIDLHHLALFGPVQVSTAAIHTLCERDIPLTYFSMGGWFYGMTRGHSLKNVFTRIEQFAAAGNKEQAVAIARRFVYGKIRNQRTLLLRNHLDSPKRELRAMKSLANSALLCESVEQLLGIEGSAAFAYFSNFQGMIKLKGSEDAGQGADNGHGFRMEFKQRNRRPPKDPVNALLSLVYSLLVKDCTLAAYAVGFDPFVGYLHQPRFGRPALALDLMEEFRPIVADSTVITLINNQMIGPDDFIKAGESVSLTPAGRKKVFMAYERRLASGVTHPVFGYKVSYRRAIELQARMLAKFLTHELEDYYPFLTR